MRIFLANAFREQMVKTDQILGECEDELVAMLAEIRSLRRSVGNVLINRPAIPPKRSEFAPPQDGDGIEEKDLTGDDISGILNIIGMEPADESTEEEYKKHVGELAHTLISPLNRGLSAMRRRLQGEDSNAPESVQPKFGT